MSYRGLTDSLPMAALVDGCADDDLESFLDNDTSGHATDAGAITYSASDMYPSRAFEHPGLIANDLDWYRFFVSPNGAVTTVTTVSAIPLQVELWAGQPGVAPSLVDSAFAGLTFVATSGLQYFVKIDPGAIARGACGPTYDLRIEAGPPAP